MRAGPLRCGGERAGKRARLVSGSGVARALGGGRHWQVGRRSRRVTRELGCGRRARAGCAERGSVLGREAGSGRGSGPKGVEPVGPRGERLGRLGLGSGKREGGSDGPDWVGFWVLPFLILSHFYF